MSSQPLSVPPQPTVESFARIAGLEALCRGSTLSVFPLLLYRAWGSAQLVSEIYFCVGLASLVAALMVPALVRVFTRRQVYLGAVSLYLVASALGMLQGKWTTLALLCAIISAAISFVCYNSYVLDHLEKTDFSRLETMRLLYGGAGWVVGPVAGVWLLSVWGGAPFILLSGAASWMAWLIWKTPLGDGKFLARASGGGAEPAHDSRRANPLALITRFFSQPRLVTAWVLPLVRSCGWWMFFVYLGIFALENKLGEQVGGVASSVANMGLFLAPLMLAWMQRRSVRAAIRVGCLGASACYLAAAVLSHWPWLTVGFLLVGTLFLVLLDTCAGLPFLMSVKPSERTEMSAVYSSFRDVSGIVSPAIAWLVLQFAPVVGVFAVGAMILLGAWLLAGQLHPELGVPGSARARQTA
jgi:ACDE family multidrug resistance protein